MASGRPIKTVTRAGRLHRDQKSSNMAGCFDPNHKLPGLIRKYGVF